MKIFVSWSGERSEALAKALKEWLPLVLHFAEPWLSKSDIQAGERWSVEIAKELESTNFGILCVTKENLTSPWILFEAGALAKSMQDGRVIPLLLDIDFKEVSGPLAQFQAKKAEQGGMRELIASLNKAATPPVPEAQLEKLFGALWPQLEGQFGAIPKGGAAIKHTRPQGEILEELVSSVRNVEMRVRDAMDDEPQLRRRRNVKISPMMVMDMTRHIGDGPHDPINLLVIGSLLRDDMPWVYELALEAYRAIKSGKIDDAKKSHRKFVEVLEMLRRGPFLEAFGGDRRYIQMLLDSSPVFEMPIEFFIESTETPRSRQRVGTKTESSEQ